MSQYCGFYDSVDIYESILWIKAKFTTEEDVLCDV